MRILFMGTPRIAARVLEAVAREHDVIEVITRPDAVSARGNTAVPSPVKATALSLGIPVNEAKSLRNFELMEHIRGLIPEAICVVAYGAILPPELLAIPRYGCINVHASLLPRWRGAAPIERAILAGDSETGVSIMRMESGLDTGPYAVMRTIAIEDKPLATLVDELADIGGEALLETLDAVASKKVTWTKQAKDGVTYASKIAKKELDVIGEESAAVLERKVRASSEAHACHARIDGKNVVLEHVKIVTDELALNETANLEPGQAVFRQKRLLLRTTDGTLEVLALKPHGKRSMDARSFCAGIQGVKQLVLTWENPR